MKLSLLSETDEELRRRSRAASIDPGDPQAMVRALRTLQRSRGQPRNEFEGQSIQKPVNTLRQNPLRWRHGRDAEFLPLISCSIDWTPNATREEALLAIIDELQRRGYTVGDWDIFQEGDNWMVLNLEVSEDFVEELAQEGNIEIRQRIYNTPEGYDVATFSAEWI